MKSKIFIILLIPAIIVGCGVTYRSDDLKSLIVPAHTDVAHTKKEGMCVVARELSHAEAETYLGIDVPKYGYAPVLINMENIGKKILKVQTPKIAVVTEKGDKIDSVPVDRVLQACRYSHLRVLPCWLILVPGIFIAIPSHSSISDANETMEKDYRSKAFNVEGYILNPDDQIHGVLFFPVNRSGSFDSLVCEVGQIGETESEFTKPFTLNAKIVSKK